MDWSLYDQSGHRKYLTGKERHAFLKSAANTEPHVHTLCWLLQETGCRLSEGLALREDQIDFGSGLVIFESLKKRQNGVYRAVPVSPAFLNKLKEVHGYAGNDAARFWPWCRMTGYRRVKEVMFHAKIVGPHASPKGLRHGFAIAALEKKVPLNLVQKWLGHARMTTTAIYAEAVGAEERKIASRLWS